MSNPTSAPAVAPGAAVPGAAPAPAGAPVQAPAAAPVAPPAQAPAAPPAEAPQGNGLELDTPAEEQAPAADAGPVVYEPTGDPALDLALDFIGARGFGPDHPAVKAAEAGDFGPLKRALAGMGDKAKGYERFLALGEKAYADTKTKNDAAAAELRGKIHTAVGGEEVWNAARAWASTAASPEERAAINQAFQIGGPVAIAMAKELTSLFKANPNATKQPAAATSANAAGKPQSQPPLTGKAYAAEAAQLRAQLGYNFDTSPQYKALQDRRAAAMRAGIA